MTAAMVPPRDAERRAVARVAPLAAATEAIIGAGVEALATELQRALAAAYEEVHEHRAGAESYREHAEADHAALQRVADLVRQWEGRLVRGGHDETGRLLEQVRQAISGSQEGSHGQEQGQQAGDTGAGWA